MANILRVAIVVKVKITRIFRSYSRVADRDHVCKYCNMPILPGDEYKGIVGIYKGKFLVEKEHVPYCPYDPNEERRREEDEEQQNIIDSESNEHTETDQAQVA